LFTICGETIAPKAITGSQVGIHSKAKVCPKCTEKVNLAWVTFP
jgi:hypothetical protein